VDQYKKVKNVIFTIGEGVVLVPLLFGGFWHITVRLENSIKIVLVACVVREQLCSAITFCGWRDCISVLSCF
jgi:hypothetical protein